MPVKRSVIGGAIAAMLLVVTPAAAQSSAKTLELARRYTAAVRLDKMMDSMMAGMVPGMMDQMAQRRGVVLDERLRAAFVEASRESVRAMTPKMIDVMVPVIAESFTEAELAAAVAYYESPPGQSLMDKMPAYMAKASPAMTKLMPEMQDDLMQRFCTKVDCDKELPAPKT